MDGAAWTISVPGLFGIIYHLTNLMEIVWFSEKESIWISITIIEYVTKLESPTSKPAKMFFRWPSLIWNERKSSASETTQWLELWSHARCLQNQWKSSESLCHFSFIFSFYFLITLCREFQCFGAAFISNRNSSLRSMRCHDSFSSSSNQHKFAIYTQFYFLKKTTYWMNQFNKSKSRSSSDEQTNYSFR